MSYAVADTIYQQLGGNRFKAMTGASSFSGSANSLSFKLPASSTIDRIKGVIVELTPDDTYTMRFLRVTGSFAKGNLGVETVKEYDGVYCDQLQDIFTQVTGLYTHL